MRNHPRAKVAMQYDSGGNHRCRRSRPGRRLAVLSLVLAAACHGAVLAQPAGAPARQGAAPQGQAATPERTTAQFGDWSVGCLALATPGGRQCEMTFSVQNQQRQVLLVLALGRASAGAPLRLAAVVPVNAMVSTPARLALDPGEPVALPFTRCDQRGCFAEIDLRDEGLTRRLRTRRNDQPGRVEWQTAAGQEVGFPVSFRGFGNALDALQREGN